jgi:hypothetical protein
MGTRGDSERVMAFVAEEEGQKANAELSVINGDLVFFINGERIPTDYIRIIQDSPNDYVKVEITFYPTSLNWRDKSEKFEKFEKEPPTLSSKPISKTRITGV